MRSSICHGSMRPLAEIYSDWAFRGKYTEEYKSLIHNVLVSARLSDTPHDTRQRETIFQTLKNQELAYTELINLLVQEYLEKEIVDRLSSGYEQGVAAFNKNNNFNVNFLKSSPWEMLFDKIGQEEFLKLVLHHNAFLKKETGGIPNYIQIYGESFKKAHNDDNSNFAKDRYIIKAKMFHKEEHRVRHLQEIPSSRSQLLVEIFEPEFTELSRKRQHTPKKLRKFAGLANQIVHNYRNINFGYILDRVCPIIEAKKGQDLRTLATEIPCVIKFVLAALDKVFPISVFGTKQNLSEIKCKISFFVSASKHVKLDKTRLLEKIKVSQIPWLARHNSDLKLSKPEFIKRKEIFRQFLSWLFEQFVSKLIVRHFHVTESADSILYYRHDVWKRLTKPFLDRYFAKYLDSKSAELPDFSFVNSSHVQGKMRLIPKTNDFRVINAPFRGTEDESFQYWNYLNNEIKPVRKILSEARRQQKYSEKYCFSVGDIPTKIVQYKNNIEAKYGSIAQTELFYVKFDAKSCFDTIPKEKVRVLSRKLISEGATYVFRQVSAGINLNKMKYTGFVVSMDDLKDVDMLKYGSTKFKNKFIADQAKTVLISFQEIMSIIDQQLDQTMVMLNRRCYPRKQGIFQGFPLSSLFCDIVYDDLVATYMPYIMDDPDSLLLRVADDFLVISTNPAQVRKVFYQIQKGFGDFHIKINSSKTMKKLKPNKSNEEEEFPFCGLTVDLRNLSVLKLSESYGHLRFTGNSYKDLYDRLIWLFKSRISNHIIKANDPKHMQENLENCLHIVKNLICTLVRNEETELEYIVNICNADHFSDFCDRLFSVAWKHLALKTQSLEEANNMWRSLFEEEFYRVLSETLLYEKL